MDDPLRRKRARFPSKKAPQDPPILKTQAYVDEANERYERAASKEKKTQIAQETGCKGTYALRKLPNHDRILGTPVEPMHLIKNIVEHVVRLITGSEDSHKVQQEKGFAIGSVILGS